MKLRFQKNIRIVNGLLHFCHYAGAVKYEVTLLPSHNSMHFTVSATVPNMEESLLGTLNDALKLPRAHEVEQNYWELDNDTDAASELTLIGMMLDQSSAVYENGVLTITGERTD